MDNIFARICSFIHELVGIPVDSITPESTPAQLHMDSLDMQELVLELEDEYDVIINEGNCATINELADQVRAA